MEPTAKILYTQLNTIQVSFKIKKDFYFLYYRLFFFNTEKRTFQFPVVVKKRDFLDSRLLVDYKFTTSIFQIISCSNIFITLYLKNKKDFIL